MINSDGIKKPSAMIQDAIETSRVLEASTKEARVWHFPRISGLESSFELYSSNSVPIALRHPQVERENRQNAGRRARTLLRMIDEASQLRLQYHLVLSQYPADSCCLSRMGMVNSISTNLMLL